MILFTAEKGHKNTIVLRKPVHAQINAVQLQNGQWLHVYAIIPQQKRSEISHGPAAKTLTNYGYPARTSTTAAAVHVLTSQLLKFKGLSSFVFLF